MTRLPPPWVWPVIVALVVGFASLSTLAGLSATRGQTVQTTRGDVAVASANAATLAAQVVDACDSSRGAAQAAGLDEEACDQAAAVEADPVEPAPGVTVTAPGATLTGAPGVPGPAGPTGPPVAAEAVAAAVAAYCTAVPSRCSQPPTEDEIAGAVAAYCASGVCTGSDGRDATPEQVAAAVAAFCADGACQGPAGAVGAAGPPGADGPPGAPGPAGRGVVSLSCTGLAGSLTVTWTDGTTDTVPCALDPGPGGGPTLP